MKYFLLAFLISAQSYGNESSAGHPGHQEKKEEMHVEVVQGLGADIKIPSVFWEILPATTYTFSNIKVELREKNPGVLKHSPMLLVFERGGGTFDLSSALTGQRGSFYLKFIFEEPDARLFMITNSRDRRIDGQKHGSGCDQMLELTQYFHSTMEKQGLLLNTTDNRHLNVLAGSFVFASSDKQQVRLSQVTFHSSENKEYYCR